MTEYRCPKCNSLNVSVKIRVDSCCDCGWRSISETPCTVCGNPSIGAVNNKSGLRYYCQDHVKEFYS